MPEYQPAPREKAGDFDLSLVAQRILKLAEISVLEHLQALARSQAAGIAHLFRDTAGDASILPAAASNASSRQPL